VAAAVAAADSGSLRQVGAGAASWVAGIVVVMWWVGSQQGEGRCGHVEVTLISGGHGSGVSWIAIGWGQVWPCRGGVMSGATAGDRDGLHAWEEEDDVAFILTHLR